MLGSLSAQWLCFFAPSRSVRSGKQSFQAVLSVLNPAILPGPGSTREQDSGWVREVRPDV